MSIFASISAFGNPTKGINNSSVSGQSLTGSVQSSNSIADILATVDANAKIIALVPGTLTTNIDAKVNAKAHL
ncbi:coiled-coil family protein [Tieghemostelium lacteum]|uniref:Coiled-coil family protein n=1 Tax=Tieghemostelium lacteum TaxID=361077 RepID=A0A151Z9S6_TIELA|nr:coiled-coil family protein [Tieghemostelium lacteum]|eukprot:KYQ90701.1 coiled-coil family protein [Tieghemostelium lacteum]